MENIMDENKKLLDLVIEKAKNEGREITEEMAKEAVTSAVNIIKMAVLASDTKLDDMIVLPVLSPMEEYLMERAETINMEDNE